jgi:hypothetical protein
MYRAVIFFVRKPKRIQPIDQGRSLDDPLCTADPRLPMYRVGDVRVLGPADKGLWPYKRSRKQGYEFEITEGKGMLGSQEMYQRAMITSNLA